jgi:hypothetical protein
MLMLNAAYRQAAARRIPKNRADPTARLTAWIRLLGSAVPFDPSNLGRATLVPKPSRF